MSNEKKSGNNEKPDEKQHLAEASFDERVIEIVNPYFKGPDGLPLAEDTMICKSCGAIIGCFAGPPPVCPRCHKSPSGSGFNIFKKLGKVFKN